MSEKEIYSFTRDVGPSDWSALPKLFGKGDKVVRFYGHTYGLDRDDMMYGGVETIPCHLPEQDGSTFFTVPVEMLVDAQGREPCGNYISRAKIQQILAAGKA